MKEFSVHPNARPFFYKKGEIGALLIHGFTNSPAQMKELGKSLASKKLPSSAQG